jgi:hypothetical protein
MHGMLKSMVDGETRKHLDIERIAAIKRAAGVFLTLHSGSGTDDGDLRQASPRESKSSTSTPNCASPGDAAWNKAWPSNQAKSRLTKFCPSPWIP